MFVLPEENCGVNGPGISAACDCEVDDSDRRLARAGAVATSVVPKMKVLRPIIMWLFLPVSG